MTDNNDLQAVRCFAGSCPIEEYFFIRTNFFKDHPTAEILEEIKTLTVKEVRPEMLSALKLPGIQPTGNLQTQVTQVHWAIWYLEKVEELPKGSLHIIPPTN